MNRRHLLQAAIGLTLADRALAGVITAAGPRLFVDGGGSPATFDYYIGPSGSDSNDGLTTSTPWAITAINTKRATYRGKRVGFLDGTYDVSGVTTRTGGFNALFEAHGGTDADHPTVFEAINHRLAVIQANNGASYPHVDCSIIGDYESAFGYFQVIGLKLVGAASKGIWQGNEGATRNAGYVVRNCEFTGFDCRGVAGGGNYSCNGAHRATGWYFADNYYHDNIGSALNSSDHWSATNLFGCINGIAEYNTCVQSGGLYGKNDAIHGNTLRYNYIDVGTMGSSSYGGIQDWAGSSETGNTTRIHNNISIGAYLNDLRKSDGGGGWYSNVEIYNNLFKTIAGGSGAESYALMMRAGAGKVRGWNNVFMEAGSSDHGFVGLNVDAPTLWDYNLYYRASGSTRWATFPSQTDNNRTGYDTFSAWKTALNIGVDAGGISGSDPLFVGSGTRADAYVLQSGSPAKNAGKNDGTSGGSSVDIGPWGNGATAIGHRW